VPANERHVVPELLAIQVEQPVAVTVLIGPQLAELGRLCWKGFLQAIGEVVVNAGILFLQRNRQGQNFLFGETVEIAHAWSCPSV
jgi:hypothetical protein